MATVLIVDDDPKIREFARRVLERAGHVTQEAPDGSTAFELLRLERFDIVLTDMMMPGTDGIELMRLLHESSSHNCAIVAMSGGVMEWSPLPSATLMGAADTLQKPFTAVELVQAIESILSATGTP